LRRPTQRGEETTFPSEKATRKAAHDHKPGLVGRGPQDGAWLIWPPKKSDRPKKRPAVGGPSLEKREMTPTILEEDGAAWEGGFAKLKQPAGKAATKSAPGKKEEGKSVMRRLSEGIGEGLFYAGAASGV